MEVPQAHQVLPKLGVSDLRVTGQDGCVTIARLPARLTVEFGQIDNNTLAWLSREAQKRHYGNLHEWTIPLRNTIR